MSADRVDMRPDALIVDFDDTDCRLRLWRGATLVGEMHPDLKAAPAEAHDMRWTGWLASSAVVEIFGTYNTTTAEDQSAIAAYVRKKWGYA